MCNLLPVDFEWMKIGASAVYTSKNCVIESEPFFWDGNWFCYISGWVDKKQCKNIHQSQTINITITREQAGYLLGLIKPPRVIIPPDIIKPVIKQIEERLG